MNPTETPNVLLVDDDSLILQTYEAALAKLRYRVVKVQDGQAALEALSAWPFDVIVSDINMPGMSGLQLLKALREKKPDVPVILITGAPTYETAVDAVEYGAFRYLTKPLDALLFRSTVEQAVRFHRLAKLKREAMQTIGRDDKVAGDRGTLESALERAMKSIHMVTQPIVNPVTKTVFAYEFLARINDEQITNPAALFDVAERLERLHEVGRVIREKVSSLLAVSPPKDPLFFVNLHPLDLTDPMLVHHSNPLHPYAGRIVFEITERKPLPEMHLIRPVLLKLRALGYQFALDDLGAGYAGLVALAALEPNFVKLDMELIRDIHKDAKRQQLVGGMIQTMNQMEVEIVAEGIETEDEKQKVSELGCSLHQGFHYAKPLSGFPQPRF